MKWEKSFKAKDFNKIPVDYVYQIYGEQVKARKVRLNIQENYSTAEIIFKTFKDEITLELPRKAEDLEI